MQLTAELSLYPLDDDYLAAIEDFIRRLRRHDGLTIVTNAMSTQIVGDDAQVFDAVRSELRETARRHPRVVLVCKFIPRELDIATTPDG